MGTLRGMLGVRKVREQEKEMGRGGGGGVRRFIIVYLMYTILTATIHRIVVGFKRFIIVYLTYTILTAMIHRIVQWGLKGL